MEEYLKAKTLVKTDQVKLVHISDDPSRKLLIFEISQEITIQYNHKGWVCDYLEDIDDYIERVNKYARKGWQQPIRWSCALNQGKLCYHIMACQLYLKQNNLLRDWMVGSDFKFLLSPTTEAPCHLSNHNKG